jgi:protocatechuate 3,4-dioxygenase beta subunit
VAVQITLISDDPTIDSPQTSSTRVDQNGKFTFRTVAPGKYTLFAQTIPGQPQLTVVNGQMVGSPPQPIVLTDAQKMWGRALVTVAGEPQIDVSVSLEPSRSISGIVVFDMAKQPDLARARIMVTLSPAPSPQPTFFGRQPQAQVDPDGRFTITGVVPGRLTIRGDGYLLKSAVVGGQDTLDFPLEFTGERDVTDAVLTFTDTFSELSGTITDPAGKPADDVIIVVAASDNRYWTPGSRRIVIARPTPDGRYMIRSLPPGAYVIAAVTDLENGGQYDPEFLRTLSAVSVPVTIMEGGKVTQDLRVK